VVSSHETAHSWYFHPDNPEDHSGAPGRAPFEEANPGDKMICRIVWMNHPAMRLTKTTRPPRTYRSPVSY